MELTEEEKLKKEQYNKEVEEENKKYKLLDKKRKELYSQIPWYKKSLLNWLLVIFLPPLGILTILNFLTGKIYIKEVDDNENLKTWGIGSKIIVFIIVIFSYSGIYQTINFNNEVACNSNTSKELVSQITLPMLEEDFTKQLMNEKDSFSVASYELIQSYSNGIPKTEKAKETLALYDESSKKAKEVFSNATFELLSSITTKKDNDINLVECEGTYELKNLNGYSNAKYEVEYKAQLTDNEDTINVEVLNYNR